MKTDNNNTSQKSFSVKLIQSLLLCSFLTTAQADDTEVFFTESKVNSNVLFIMDNSGSMTEAVAGTNFSDAETIPKSYTIANNSQNTAVEDRLQNTFANDWDDIIVDSWWKTGIRFPNIDIPEDSTITRAFIRFTGSQTQATVEPADWAVNVGYPMTMNIHVEDKTNPHKFNNGHRIHDRELNDASVDWPVAIPNAVGDTFDSADIKDLVQVIVSKDSWESGKAIAFVLKNDDNGLRYFYSDGNSAPVLHIDYRAAGETKTRMQVMQSALKTVLKDAPSNLNVGIMNYGSAGNRDKANGVKFPVIALNKLARPIVENSLRVGGTPNWSISNIPEPSDTVTVRNYLTEIADSWDPVGITPIVDSLYEAARYYRGDTLYWGNAKARKPYAAHPSTYAHPDPDPDNIEPLRNLDRTLVSECGGNPGYTTKYDTPWYSSKTEWNTGTGTHKCPATIPPARNDAGSKANCNITPDIKYQCGDSEWDNCPDGWVSGYYPEKTCTGVDELGNQTGCDDPDYVNGHCRNDNYDTPHDVSWCKYRYCARLYEYPEPPETPKYISPIVAGCQSNNIILMSDGKPEYKGSAAEGGGINKKARSANKIVSLTGQGCVDEPFGYKSGKCGSELTHFLADKANDQASDIDDNQTINTHVIGFSSGITQNAENYLKSLVTLEDDPNTAEREGYFSATNEAELARAFQETLDEIAKEARSQASPGYSVNVKSGLEHEDDIYIPVFNKTSGALWNGNLKKFKLVDTNNHRFIKGKITKAGSSSGAGYIEAMDEYGIFLETAWDEWSQSDSADGEDVEAGGTASLLLHPDSRNLYTDVASNNISAGINQLKFTNANITQEMLFDAEELELTDEAATTYRKQLIQFIRGWEAGQYNPNANPPVGTPRRHMGDMLHSEPVVITYPGENKQYIFAATNEGYIHAFDTTTGAEKFAFMPKELFKIIEGQFSGRGGHKYGIDGSISYSQEGGQTIIYFGLRRGGRSYYALDVTNIDSPKLLWKIDNNSAGFSRLGQSWSTPYLARVKDGNEVKVAVIFTGGNDPASDYGSGDGYTSGSVTTDITSTMGDDIYIVDANTGDLLWNMRSDIDTTVNHALPGGARILDVNRNGLLDRIYFADTGGDIWRIDLDETLGDDSVLSKIASLGGAGVHARKFYNEPDVALLRSKGKPIFSVSIGSGLRAHPMNDVIEDHMFVLLDESPLTPLPNDYADKIVLTDLEEISIITSGEETITKTVNKSTSFEGKKITQVPGKRGWYVTFAESGEKVLASSLTFEGNLLFTTLVPKTTNISATFSECEAPATQGRLYAMSLLTGEASVDVDRNDTLTDNDIFDTVALSEIPGTPQSVFNKLVCEAGECTHNVDIRVGKKSSEIGVSNVEQMESIYWSDPEVK